MSGGLCVWIQSLAVAKKSFLVGRFAQLIILDDIVFLRSCGQWPDLCSSWLSFLAALCSLMLQRETVALRTDNLSSLLVPSLFLCRLSKGVWPCPPASFQWNQLSKNWQSLKEEWERLLNDAVRLGEYYKISSHLGFLLGPAPQQWWARKETVSILAAAQPQTMGTEGHGGSQASKIIHAA